MNTSPSFAHFPTPALLVDEAKLQANIARMQARCDAHGVRLWPHIKTHKTLEIARLQLEAGAEGLVCAKLGEAETMLAAGVRRIFLAYPLVDPETQAARVRGLVDSLDAFFVAATSVAQAEALGSVSAASGATLSVLMAVDTGLGREGARGIAEARQLADTVRRHPNLRLAGIFTHEGHAYRTQEELETFARDIVAYLQEVQEAVGPGEDGAPLPLWPGCSVTAEVMATVPGVYAVRPGTYVFGDLALCGPAGPMTPEQISLTILTTVVDRPQPGLALVDGGSKTFSSDRTPTDIFASAADGRDLHLTRLSEEHGFVTGSDTDTLRIGERVAWIPAHVCPTVNLTDELQIVRDGAVRTTWRVAARGKVR